MKSWIKAAALSLSAFLIAGTMALAGGEWEGVWRVKGTTGEPFEITLSADGSAKANLHEDMVGHWKAEGDTAVISWNTGWTTKIAREGGGYKKMGYREGVPLDGPPSNSSDAEKVK